MAGRVVVLDKDLLKAEAFRNLPRTAIIVLMDFMMKRQIGKRKGRPGRDNEVNILNNGEIEYCYSEAEKKGIPRQTFARTLDTLIERGFIDLAHSGAGGKKGDKSLYAISTRWKQWGTESFKPAARPKDLRQGRGFAAVKNHRKTISNADVTPIGHTNVTRKAV